MTQSDVPRRSDATRAHILSAARGRFAADGYHRATIRAIAADAGIDPSMVMRYYGNKSRLFAATVDLDLAIPNLTAVAKDRLGRELVAHFLRRWEGDPTDALLTLLRSATTDRFAAEQLRHMFTDQLVPALAEVIDVRNEAPYRAGLIATQMLGLALCRVILQIPPVAALRADQVVSRFGPTIQRYLTAPLNEGDDSPVCRLSSGERPSEHL